METEQGFFRASAPSGTSVGKYEAVQVEPKKAVENIEKIIAPKLRDQDVADQQNIDQILIDLDGTENKSRLGANALLAVSVACLRAGAAALNFPLYSYISQICRGRPSANSPEGSPLENLPIPCFNVLEGGVHAGNELDIQEFMIVPQMESFKENLTIAVEIYHSLGKILEKKFGRTSTNVGDEGGFAPPIKKTKEALDLIIEAIKKVGYEGQVKIGLDCAASEFFKNGKYTSGDNYGVRSKIENEFSIFFLTCNYNFEGKKLTGEKLLKFYQRIIEAYPILFLEDPFAADDWQSFQALQKNCNKSLRSQNFVTDGILVVGDDLTVTNPERIKLAKEKNACNAIVLKPNQIGTVTETLRAAKLAKEFGPEGEQAPYGAGWKIVVSHRSGDTCDDFIADLAVGVAADYIKSGAPARGERVAKYNRLLRIEEEL